MGRPFDFDHEFIFIIIWKVTTSAFLFTLGLKIKMNKSLVVMNYFCIKHTNIRNILGIILKKTTMDAIFQLLKWWWDKFKYRFRFREHYIWPLYTMIYNADETHDMLRTVVNLNDRMFYCCNSSRQFRLKVQYCTVIWCDEYFVSIFFKWFGNLCTNIFNPTRPTHNLILLIELSSIALQPDRYY